MLFDYNEFLVQINFVAAICAFFFTWYFRVCN